jgi:hypothetical protein
VSRERPEAGCREIRFARHPAISAAGEVALEDYARVLFKAAAAEAVPEDKGAGRIIGVHLCGPAVPPDERVSEDLEAFARELAEESGEGLGWT